MNILELVKSVEKTDEQIREYLYPKLRTLLLEGKLNNGKYNEKRTPEEIISISNYSATNETVGVSMEIWWGGDVYDYDAVVMTKEEWDAIPNYVKP